MRQHLTIRAVLFLLLVSVGAPGYTQYSEPSPLSITIEQAWARQFPTVDFSLPTGATIDYEVVHTTTGGRDWLADYVIYSKSSGKQIDYFTSFAPGNTVIRSVKAASWTNNSSVTDFYMEARISGYFSSRPRSIKSVLTAIGYRPNPNTPIIETPIGTQDGVPFDAWNAMPETDLYTLMADGYTAQ